MNQAERRYLPATANQLPDATRLAFVLPKIEAIAAQAVHEKALRDTGSAYLHEAIGYMPPLMTEMGRQLSPALRLLRPAESEVLRQKRNDDAVPDAVSAIHRQEGYVTLSMAELEHRFYNQTRQEAQQMIRALHPDTAPPSLAETVGNAEQVRLLTQALRVYEQHDPVRLQEVFWQIIPASYLGRVLTALEGGKSLEDIASSQPDLVPSLEALHYRATVVFDPYQTRSRVLRPEDAKERLDSIRHKKNIHDRDLAAILAYQTVNGIVGRIEERGLSGQATRLTRANEEILKIAAATRALGEFLERHLALYKITGKALEARNKLDAEILAIAPFITEAALHLSADARSMRALDGAIESIHKMAKRARDQIERYAKALDEQTRFHLVRSKRINPDKPLGSELERSIVYFTLEAQDEEDPVGLSG